MEVFRPASAKELNGFVQGLETAAFVPDYLRGNIWRGVEFRSLLRIRLCVLGAVNLMPSQPLMAHDDTRPLLLRGFKLLAHLHCLSSLVDMLMDPYFPTSETVRRSDFDAWICLVSFEHSSSLFLRTKQRAKAFRIGLQS